MTMRAACLVHDTNGYHFETRDVERPSIKSTEILVKISATGVCGSDFHLAEGHLGPTSSILGHEGVGRVVEVGSAVDIAIGTRVGISWVRDLCGTCVVCLTDGGETRCRAFITSGRQYDGTWAEYAIVPSTYIIRLPEVCSDEEVAPILCGGVTAYKAVKICGATPGHWVLISGAGGGVGALAVQYAKAMGYRVLAIDVGKREYCLSIGAEAYVEAGEVVPEAVGPTQAAIVTAGVAPAYRAAIDLLAPFGTLVCVGIPPADQEVAFNPTLCINKGISIIGSAVGTRKDIVEAIEFVSRGLVKPSIKLATFDDLTAISQNFSKVGTSGHANNADKDRKRPNTY
jgi:alcohol dehydrogenase, propanol-preferring